MGLVSRLLFAPIFESKSGQLEPNETGASYEKYLQKIGFRKNRFCMIRGSFFKALRMEVFGAAFLTFVALDTGLKIEWFFEVTLGILNSTPELRHTKVGGENTGFASN